MGLTETGPVTRSLRGHFAPRLAGYLKVSSPHGPVTGTVPPESCVFRVAGGPQAATAEVVSSLGKLSERRHVLTRCSRSTLDGEQLESATCHLPPQLRPAEATGR